MHDNFAFKRNYTKPDIGNCQENGLNDPGDSWRNIDE